MAKNSWEITENNKSRRWYLHIPAGFDPESYPNVEEIRRNANAQGLDPYSVVSDAVLEKNLNKAISVSGEEFSFPITLEPSFDVRLNIDPDKTRAFLYIRKSADRKAPIDLKLVSTVINNSHLKGLDAAKIQEAILQFRNSPYLELNDFMLAEGTPPGRGKDREFLTKVEWLPEEEAKLLSGKVQAWAKSMIPTEADKGFPAGNAKRIAIVSKDQIVYELSPVELGPSGSDVFGRQIPGLPGNDPFIQVFDNLSIGPAGLKAERNGLLLADDTDNRLKVRVIPYLDGKAIPVISPDNMNVTLLLESEEGAGTPLTLEAALTALGARGIRGQIDTALIEKTVSQVRKTRNNAEIVVLRGQKAIPPGASRITWFTGFPGDEVSVNITPGDRIISIEQIPAGADGVDVYGTVLKAAGGHPEPVPGHDESITAVTSDGATVYTANASGELVLRDGTLGVSENKTISTDINDTTGDLSFPGNLTVNGCIRKGRIVRATGAVTINGDAEAALVSADTTVTMNGGILGSGRGTVWAKQEIHLTFAENARVLAGGDISIANYCFQCTVKTNGTLFMTGNPAVLLGGNIRASKGVEVYELGSEKTIRTSISFGQNYLVSDQIEVCEKEVQKVKETIEKIDTEMKKPAATNPRIHELRRKKLELMKHNDKLTVRIFTLKEQFETHILSHIRVDNTVYPGVILESHGRYYEVREPRSHVIFFFDQTTGQITCTPIENE